MLPSFLSLCNLQFNSYCCFLSICAQYLYVYLRAHILELVGCPLFCSSFFDNNYSFEQPCGAPEGLGWPLQVSSWQWCSSLSVDADEWFLERGRVDLFIKNNCWSACQVLHSYFRVYSHPLSKISVAHFGPAGTITASQVPIQFVPNLNFHVKSECADSTVMKNTWNPELSIPKGELFESKNMLKPYLLYTK